MTGTNDDEFITLYFIIDWIYFPPFLGQLPDSARLDRCLTMSGTCVRPTTVGQSASRE